MTKLAAWARLLHEEGHELVLCGDMNVTRSDVDVHPKERQPNLIGQRPEERELFEKLGEHLAALAARSTPIIRTASRGGRPGAICARATLAGASLHPPSLAMLRAVPLSPTGTSDHAPVMMIKA